MASSIYTVKFVSTSLSQGVSSRSSTLAANSFRALKLWTQFICTCDQPRKRFVYCTRGLRNDVYLWRAVVGVVGELLLQKQVDLTSLSNDELPLDLPLSVGNAAFWGETRLSMGDDRGGASVSAKKVGGSFTESLKMMRNSAV